MRGTTEQPFAWLKTFIVKIFVTATTLEKIEEKDVAAEVNSLVDSFMADIFALKPQLVMDCFAKLIPEKLNLFLANSNENISLCENILKNYKNKIASLDFANLEEKSILQQFNFSLDQKNFLIDLLGTTEFYHLGSLNIIKKKVIKKFDRIEAIYNLAFDKNSSSVFGALKEKIYNLDFSYESLGDLHFSSQEMTFLAWLPQQDLMSLKNDPPNAFIANLLVNLYRYCAKCKKVTVNSVADVRHILAPALLTASKMCVDDRFYNSDWKTCPLEKLQRYEKDYLFVLNKVKTGVTPEDWYLLNRLFFPEFNPATRQICLKLMLPPISFLVSIKKELLVYSRTQEYENLHGMDFISQICADICQIVNNNFFWGKSIISFSEMEMLEMQFETLDITEKDTALMKHNFIQLICQKMVFKLPDLLENECQRNIQEKYPLLKNFDSNNSFALKKALSTISWSNELYSPFWVKGDKTTILYSKQFLQDEKAFLQSKYKSENNYF